MKNAIVVIVSAAVAALVAGAVQIWGQRVDISLRAAIVASITVATIVVMVRWRATHRARRSDGEG